MDLIDRREAIDAVLDRMDVEKYGRNAKPDEIQWALEKLPSAQPEIVRCKDCKHRYVEDMIWHCPFGLMGGENFFCGYGSLGAVQGDERMSKKDIPIITQIDQKDGRICEICGGVTNSMDRHICGYCSRALALIIRDWEAARR